MSDIVTYKSVKITDIMSRLDDFKYNPSAIQRTILEVLDEVTSGTVDIVDPTNPFVFLLEASSVNTALAINENVINLRKQYPALAQTEDEVYLHMADDDFVNRFAVPSSADFIFSINANDIINKTVYDPLENNFKATIPRDTQFIVDDIIFTLQYPIHIRRFNNGLVQISYDGDVVTPLQTLSNSLIEYTVRRDSAGLDWVFFKIPVSQFVVDTTYFTTQQSITFSQDILFTNQYYFVRVYTRGDNTSNVWKEIYTTHTDQVFDPFKATVVIKVYESKINIFIPSIYLNTNLIGGDIRVDLYTTKGDITVNLSNYKADSFTVKLMAIDELRDLTPYTTAMLGMTFYGYSEQVVSGGTNGISFAKLRERVIFNSIGDRQLPITNVQLESYVNNKGFDLVKNIDVVTNRVFLATKKLPNPINYKLLTPASIGITSFISRIGVLKTYDSVRNNADRITILSDNLYESNNGILSMLNSTQINAIKSLPITAMVEAINSKQYLYTPFYYVLDSSLREFEVRPYHLDQPKASALSFLTQNETLQLPVNTSKYELIKIPNGYRLIIVTVSGTFYKQLADNLIGAQLAYYPVGENHLAYVPGVMTGHTADDERTFTFDIITNYDLDVNDNLCITNAKMFTHENIKTWVNLTTDFFIFHTTSSSTNKFVPDVADSLLGKFLLPNGSVTNTQEKITLELGTSLKNLWSRSRSMASGLEYAKHTVDIPLLADKNIYAIDPITNSAFSFDGNGEIVYTIITPVGDPLLTEEGLPLYKHRVGDVVLDGEGKPTILGGPSVDKEIDLLHVDGKYYFANDDVFIEYKNELAGIINTWVTTDLKSIQALLLEQTKIFFYPKTTLGMVKIYPDSTSEDHVSSEQSLVIDLFVKDKIYKDAGMRQQLIEGTIQLIDTYIDSMNINLTELTIMLKTFYNESVVSLNINGLGGSKNYQVINVALEHNRLCLKKKLTIQQDGRLIIKEDVTINFHNVERVL